MASNSYMQYYADGTKKKVRRSVKQGRRPRGLTKPRLYRLYKEDEEKMKLIKDRFGYMYNENEFVRDAVHEKLINSVYTELL